jgi:hypothetical protein
MLYISLPQPTTAITFIITVSPPPLPLLPSFIPCNLLIVVCAPCRRCHHRCLCRCRHRCYNRRCCCHRHRCPRRPLSRCHRHHCHPHPHRGYCRSAYSNPPLSLPLVRERTLGNISTVVIWMWREGRGGREGMQVRNSALCSLPPEIKHNWTTDSTFEYVCNSI